MIKKTIMMIAILLAVGLTSCTKDPELPTGYFGNDNGGGSGGGSTTDSITISVSTNPSDGGDVIGGGKYPKGGTCVVTASANEGYVFTDWTENGTQVSTSVSYSFTADADRTLVANFSISAENYTISAVASPLYGGIVNGSGTYEQGQTCTLTAIANEGYTFINWTENGEQVSTDANYTFTVTGNRTLVASFTFTPNESDYTNIVLNELNGDTKFIEIYNKGDMDLPLEGMYLMKDDYFAGAIWTADATIVAPAHGYVVLYSIDTQADHPELGENMFFNSGMSSKKTIRITLFMPDGTERDVFSRGTTGEWGVSVSNVAPLSYARTPNGGEWKLADPTPGEANPASGDDIPDFEEPINYTITVSASPSNGGTVGGGGTYQQGQSCTVTAVPNNSYTFSYWTENGTQVSTEASYTFIVTGDRILVANFSFILSEGSGTADDPYNVAAGIGLQGEQPTAWVHGYIVGAVKQGTSTVTSNNDVIWSGTFDSETNVVIADDASCNEVSQCIIVNLPAGKPLRAQVNLKSNPGNLGKQLAVLGKLRTYLGQAGLRDSGGTEEDFVLEGGDPTPPPTPGGELQSLPYIQSFATSFGTYMTYDVSGSQSWMIDFSTAKMTGYENSTTYANEDWLISSPVAITGVNDAKMTVVYIGRYFGNINQEVTIWASTDYTWGDSPTNANWLQVPASLSQDNNWNDFLTAEIALTEYVGQTVTFAVKYTSTDSKAGTILIQSIAIQ